MRRKAIEKVVKNYLSKLVAKNKVKEKIIELNLVHDFYGMMYRATRIIYRRFTRLSVLDIENYIQKQFDEFMRIYNVR